MGVQIFRNVWTGGPNISKYLDRGAIFGGVQIFRDKCLRDKTTRTHASSLASIPQRRSLPAFAFQCLLRADTEGDRSALRNGEGLSLACRETT